MVLHQDTWYLRPAFVGAGNSIVFARVKMGLSEENHTFTNSDVAEVMGQTDTEVAIIAYRASSNVCKKRVTLRNQIRKLSRFGHSS
jgi:predicted site-specific integrase-resolvase